MNYTDTHFNHLDERTIMEKEKGIKSLQNRNGGFKG